MADVTITGLPNASALTGAERIAMDQGGATVDAAASAIAALATKATVGLGNADNTSDIYKPVSAPQQAALDGKASTGLISSSGLTMTAGVLGRDTGTGAPLVLSLGSGLSIVGGALTVTASGSGTVTSVGMTVPTGFAITGSPITTTGTLAITFAAGYGLPLTASQASWDVAAALAATAVQPAGLASYVQTGDTRLSDPREWSAATVAQATAEAGTSTARVAYNPLRVFQSIAAYIGANFSAVGRALATAANAAAARTTLELGTLAMQSGTFSGTSSGTNTGDQDLSGKANAGPIGSSGLTMTAGVLGRESGTGAPQVLTLGSGLSIVGGALVVTASGGGSFDPASPGAIGGTTAAAGSFTALSASTSLLLPNTAGTAARHLYASGDTLRYRDSGNAERLLLNATDNLANLGSRSAARTNLELGTAATAAASDFLPATFTIVNVSYGATTNIDFTADTGKLLVIGTLTGNLAFTFSNIVQGKMVTVDILCDATQRTLTFPANARFLGSKPASIAASKAAAISFTVTRSPSSATDDSAVRVAYGVQT